MLRFSFYTYPITINQSYLDSFDHVNNAMYLTLFEKARWDLINKNGYGLDKIKETGLGPTILEIKLQFLRELRLHDEIIIETQVTSYHKKICIISQRMVRDTDVCCLAEFTTCLFDLDKRKMVPPTPEWLHAVGLIS